MKRTQVARECADALHATEASLEGALASAKATLERLSTAKVEMGLNGTLGDAGLARMAGTVAALEQALEEMYASHREAYGVMQAIDLRGRMEIYRTEGAFDREAADEPKVA